MLKCIDEKKKTLEMVEGDFGLIIPFELMLEDEESISELDSFSIKIFTEINTEPIIEKIYTDIQNNIIEFELSKQESLKMPVGTYYYDVDWFQGQNFLGNIIKKAKIDVLEKAGVPSEN